MKILKFASTDPAGMAIRFTNAINRYTEHRARLVTFGTVYSVDFETDLHVPELREDYAEVVALCEEADVIHFHNMIDENWPLGPHVLRDLVRGKPIIYHEHGHPYFLANAADMRRRCEEAGRHVLVATPDLLNLWPGSHWQPNLVPINDVGYLPAPGNHAGDQVRMCQAPTRRWHKHTAEFIEVTDALMARLTHVDRDIIENVSHAECLRRKRRCQVVFDHMNGHFGISSLESLSQGVPVVAGLDDWNIDQLKKAGRADTVPWIIARTRDQLATELEALAVDRDLRAAHGAESRRWMERHWTERQLIAQLIDYYERLL